jgi:hypothetical protein
VRDPASSRKEPRTPGIPEVSGSPVEQTRSTRDPLTSGVPYVRGSGQKWRVIAYDYLSLADISSDLVTPFLLCPWDNHSEFAQKTKYRNLANFQSRKIKCPRIFVCFIFNKQNFGVFWKNKLFSFADNPLK